MNVILDAKSWYSLLEGFDSPERLVERAASLGYESVALTDVNSVMGIPSFVEAASKVGIRPITGATLAHPAIPGCSRVVALAGSIAGYGELCSLITEVKRLEERENADPKDFLSLLCQRFGDLRFLVDDVNWLGNFREIHGNRVYALVVRPSPGVCGKDDIGWLKSKARYAESLLLERARELGVSSVVSGRVMMADPERARFEPVLRAIRHRGLVDGFSEPPRIGPENSLISPEKMSQRFSDLPESVATTRDLAREMEGNVMPRGTIFPTPRKKWDVGEQSRLRHLCKRGMIRRGLIHDSQARIRLDRELHLVQKLGFSGYFLVVRSIAKKSRRMGLSMALRGSAGNSLVCYLLEITDVDPLRFELPLERFLHEGRTDLPDIDLDFDWKTRDQIIEWAIRHFGKDRTCRISSHLFFQPRVALREASRAHGLSNDQTTNLLKSITQSADELLSDPVAAKNRGVPFAFPLEAERWWRILEDAAGLLGMPHHLSIHPGGIVMVPDRIDRHVPIQRSAKGVDVTQFDKYSIESTGLVKIDLLGNRALSTVDEVARRLQTPGKKGHPIAEDDGSVLALLRAGETLGVGQLESPGMRHLLVQLAPKNIDDVIIALALIRPGAAGVGMKAKFCAWRRGAAPPPKQHPLVKKLLKGTEGMMIFEDDGLRLLQGLCNLSAPEADRFRKRIAKNHHPEIGASLRREFMDMATPSGVGPEELEDIWVQLEKFNQYSFCKSHAVSYGLIAWRSAWCKANEPLLFWTAALNNNAGMYPRRVYIGEIVRSGIAVLGPCVNRSLETFEPEGNAIRTGLGAIAGLAGDLVTQILLERNTNGLFTDADSFRLRAGIPPEAMDRLRRGGALDCFGLSRPTLALQGELKRLAGWQTGGSELFEKVPDLEWIMPTLDPVEKSREEYPILGMTVSCPLQELMSPVIRSGLMKAGLDPSRLCPSTGIGKYLGKEVMVAGMVAAARGTHTKSGKLMQFLTLEDGAGFVDLTLFPGDCDILHHITEGPYVGIGVVEEDLGVVTVRAKRVFPIHGRGNVIPIRDETTAIGFWEEEL